MSPLIFTLPSLFISSSACFFVSVETKISYDPFSALKVAKEWFTSSFSICSWRSYESRAGLKTNVLIGIAFIVALLTRLSAFIEMTCLAISFATPSSKISSFRFLNCSFIVITSFLLLYSRLQYWLEVLASVLPENF